jgi:hypothetical protein
MLRSINRGGCLYSLNMNKREYAIGSEILARFSLAQRTRDAERACWEHLRYGMF